MNNHQIKIAIAQISPVLLNREGTLVKMLDFVKQASREGADLIVFGEALLPGYPFWLEHTDAARFNSKIQKEIHAQYLREAVQVESGHLDAFTEAARDHNMAMMFGIIERPSDRGGHSLYCSLIYIDQTGKISPSHRKLMPTYEERLSWSPGDGHGLQVHSLGPFTVGGLNCWENWMPMARMALYGMGEDLHIALWPGSVRNTVDITRFIAMESRSYVISVSGLMSRQDLKSQSAFGELFEKALPAVSANGGSCVADPAGNWVLEPLEGKEQMLLVTLDHQRVLEERQNFDSSGHYSRPDVLELRINTTRQAAIKIEK